MEDLGGRHGVDRPLLVWLEARAPTRSIHQGDQSEGEGRDVSTPIHESAARPTRSPGERATRTDAGAPAETVVGPFDPLILTSGNGSAPAAPWKKLRARPEFR